MKNIEEEFIELDRKENIENKELEKIIESGKKKEVDNMTYFEHFDPSDCRYCMNFIFKSDTCKKNMPNIDPWYTKDNDLLDECEEWEYVYTSK